MAGLETLESSREARSNPESPSVNDLLYIELDELIKEHSQALCFDAPRGVTPTEAEWATATQIVLVGNTLADRVNEDWLQIVRHRMYQHIEDDPEANPNLGLSDLFDSSFEDPNVVQGILGSAKTKNSLGDAAQDVIYFHSMTPEYQKIYPNIELPEGYLSIFS